MTDKYQAIRDALAAGPTPGPYFVSDDIPPRVYALKDGEEPVVAGTDAVYPWGGIDDGKEVTANANLFAACCPETIAALLAELDTLADTQRAIIEAAEKRGYDRAIAEIESMRADAERSRFEAAFRKTFNATKKTTGERYEQ